MNEIYVSGHRNPDTDSIVASMAYAKLRNALGDREYKAVRIGAINDETQHMLDHFGFEPPEFIKSMRTQVRDLDFDRPPELNCSVTMDLAWRTMREGEIATMRLERAQHLLTSTTLSISEIASRCGFSSPQYLIRSFTKKFGKPPAAWRHHKPTKVG